MDIASRKVCISISRRDFDGLIEMREGEIVFVLLPVGMTDPVFGFRITPVNLQGLFVAAPGFIERFSTVSDIPQIVSRLVTPRIQIEDSLETRFRFITPSGIQQKHSQAEMRNVVAGIRGDRRLIIRDRFLYLVDRG